MNMSDKYLGQLLIEQLKSRLPDYRLEHHGFKAYSQADEDGILQEIFSRIGITNKQFVEFGVGDGIENNTIYLLYQGWGGLWIEANKQFCAAIQNKYKRLLGKQLTLVNHIVTRDNINGILRQHNISEPDLLVIDIDGNDYHILDTIDIKPRVICIEYNAKFKPPTKWIMPYDPTHQYDGTDYFGASFQSILELGKEKGYELIATNIAGTNIFLVRSELSDKFEISNQEELYNPPRYELIHAMMTGHPIGIR